MKQVESTKNEVADVDAAGVDGGKKGEHGAAALRAAVIGIIFLFGALGVKGKDSSGPEAQRPNIVFILADDMGVGDVGCYNPDSEIPTPNLDRLADEGRFFTDAHSPGSVCMPTRYGLLTGEYPFRIDWRQWNKEALTDPDQLTLASLLGEHGYRTGMVGKWHLGFSGGNDFDSSERLNGGPVDRGFDSFFGMHASLDIPPYFYIRGAHPVTVPSQTIDARQSTKPIWNNIQGPFWRAGGIGPGFRHVGVLPRFREQAVRFLESHRRETPDRPCFLYLALPAPHTPWLPLEEFRGKSGAGMYGDFVAQVDDLVGGVLKALDRLGMTEETLVIFTSDNGPVWYAKDEKRFDHRSAHIYRGMKGDVWEGGHRMPFIARWPGEIPAGTSSDELIAFTDMAATFAALVGEELPKDQAIDSYNVLPALLGQDYEGAIHDELINNAIGYNAIRQGDWKLIPGLGSGGFSDPRQRQPKDDEPPAQLYNLAEDPGEQNNVYDKHPQIAKELEKRLQEYENGYHAPRHARDVAAGKSAAADPPLTLSWEDNFLTIHGDAIPGGDLEVMYLEAFCRPNSHTTDWVEHTVIDHETTKVGVNEATTKIRLRSELKDGVVVTHRIKAGNDEIDFRVKAHNPTDQSSDVHWAQPCPRVGKFTGTGPEQTSDKYAYLPKSFVFLDGSLERMPTEPWATEARYTPGQVWRAPGVPPADVNPRPLNPKVPSNGLIGCFSADESMILATAWEPYQELFQGVIRCLHSDFRIGGLDPGETKRIRGKLYIMPADVSRLLKRYRHDFPEQVRRHKASSE